MSHLRTQQMYIHTYIYVKYHLIQTFCFCRVRTFTGKDKNSLRSELAGEIEAELIN
jgi:hypothetical protein